MVDHANQSQKCQLVRLEPQQLQRLQLHDPDNILLTPFDPPPHQIYTNSPGIGTN